MKRMHIAALVLGLAGFALSPAASAYTQERHDEQRDQRDEHARPEYHFRQEDGARLRQNYRNIGRVDVHHRHEFAAGERLPNDWRGRMRAVPRSVVRELPPPPPGYVFGYIDGYCVAYNPHTLMIADVIDLANLR